MRAKETVDGNRVVEDGRKGEINGKLQGKGGEKKKDGEVRMGWNEGEWRQCGGRISGKKKKMTGKGTENGIYGNIVVYFVFDS